MNATFLDNLLVKLQTIGQELLQLQKSPELRVELKADASPKSNADEYSHTELMAFLILRICLIRLFLRKEI